MLETILRDDQVMNTFIKVCVRLCRHYGFHGWLLNIENKVNPELIPQLLKLVKLLSSAVKQDIGQEGLVLWYDSVTIKGDLHWQDELNSLNKPFFDLCDGIFLNYTWKCGETSDKGCGADGTDLPRDNLASSINALDNDTRRTDIFVGVDVFGRGCLGGGGFQCHLPLKEIRKRSLSVAIFAPGWTFEIPARSRDTLGAIEVRKQFLAREFSFWGLLHPFLNFHAPQLQSKDEAHLVAKAQNSLRFKTSFSLGCGGGNCEENLDENGPASGWYNLREMEFQPSFVVVNEGENNDPNGLGFETEKETCKVFANPDDVNYVSYVSDKCSYKLSQSLHIVSRQPTTVPLFLLDLSLKQNDSVLFILIIKSDKEKSMENCCLQLKLGTECEQQGLVEIKPRILTSEELFMICSDPSWGIIQEQDQPQYEDKNCEWQKLAFFLNVTDNKVLHKIGLDIEKAGETSFYIGEFSIYKK